MLKLEENKLVVTGSLVTFRFGVNKYDKNTEKYYVTVKVDPDQLTDEDRQTIHDTYFADAKEKYIPDMFKVDAKTGKVKKLESEEALYLNLKSQYEVNIFFASKGNKKFTWEEYNEEVENMTPYGSNVTLACRLKSGSIYPLALKFNTVEKATVDSYF